MGRLPRPSGVPEHVTMATALPTQWEGGRMIELCPRCDVPVSKDWLDIDFKLPRPKRDIPKMSEAELRKFIHSKLCYDCYYEAEE